MAIRRTLDPALEVHVAEDVASLELRCSGLLHPRPLAPAGPKEPPQEPAAAWSRLAGLLYLTSTGFLLRPVVANFLLSNTIFIRRSSEP